MPLAAGTVHVAAYAKQQFMRSKAVASRFGEELIRISFS